MIHKASQCGGGNSKNRKASVPLTVASCASPPRSMRRRREAAPSEHSPPRRHRGQGRQRCRGWKALSSIIHTPKIISDDQTSLSAAGWGYVPGWTLRGYCGALAKVRDAVRNMVLLLMLAAITACSRYDPVPPGGIVTCHTAQPSGERPKGCG